MRCMPCMRWGILFRSQGCHVLLLNFLMHKLSVWAGAPASEIHRIILCAFATEGVLLTVNGDRVTVALPWTVNSDPTVTDTGSDALASSVEIFGPY